MYPVRLEANRYRLTISAAHCARKAPRSWAPFFFSFAAEASTLLTSRPPALPSVRPRLLLITRPDASSPPLFVYVYAGGGEGFLMQSAGRFFFLSPPLLFLPLRMPEKVEK